MGNLRFYSSVQITDKTHFDNQKNNRIFEKLLQELSCTSLKDPSKGVFVLCKTSNPSSQELEFEVVINGVGLLGDSPGTIGRKELTLYRHRKTQYRMETDTRMPQSHLPRGACTCGACTGFCPCRTLTPDLPSAPQMAPRVQYPGTGAGSTPGWIRRGPLWFIMGGAESRVVSWAARAPA